MTAPRREGPATDRSTDPATDPATERSTDPAAEESARRRRRAAVFGEVLPEGTSDERPDAWGEGGRDGRAEEWLRQQVPPHHG